MFSFLKNHPFAVEAFFESSIVLTFAVSKEQIQHLIPPCLALDIFKDKWAFIAVAMVQTTDLRPKGFPRFMGNDFFLIGYRVFVRFINEGGKRLRGLYILKSQTDKRKMEVLGNLCTQYSYTTTDINQVRQNGITEFSSAGSGFYVQVEENDDKTIALPESSPFADWKEARRFAGPLPFTFTYNPATRKVLIIEGVRQHWDPVPLRVAACNFPFLNSLELEGIKLANAFIIRDIPYYWKKGKIEKWKQ